FPSTQTGQYTVDPDGDGPAQPFTFGNPDFNFKSVRVNAIFRWDGVWVRSCILCGRRIGSIAQIPESLPHAVMFAVGSPHILMTSFSFAWRIGSAGEGQSHAANDVYRRHPRL